MAKEIYDK